MKRTLIAVFILLSQGAALGAARFSVIQTGSGQMPEAMVFKGGDLFKLKSLTHSAFLIHSNGEYMLFETGLGRHIDEQRNKTLPWWKRWMFPYEKEKSVAKALGGRIQISKIFLSHTHWDHAGGIEDFPEATTYLSAEELEAFKKHPENGRFPVQVDVSKVKVFPWKEEAFLGFPKHHDVYGNKEVVIVPLEGHTPGSIGLYLKTSDNEYLFVGDAVWAREQVEKGIPKSLLASSLADTDKEKTLNTIKELGKLEDRVEIIPTHDANAQKNLKHFPEWNE